MSEEIYESGQLVINGSLISSKCDLIKKFGVWSFRNIGLSLEDLEILLSGFVDEQRDEGIMINAVFVFGKKTIRFDNVEFLRYYGKGKISNFDFVSGVIQKLGV